MKVFVGQPLVEPSTTDLLAGHTVVTGGGNLPRSEWPLLRDADALLPTPRERITAGGARRRAPRRGSWRATPWASITSISQRAAAAASWSRTRRTSSPDATADLAWALILAVARRIREGEALARSGTWDGWKPRELLGVSLAGRTLGIYGMGRIGRAVARRGEAFGMKCCRSTGRHGGGVPGISFEGGCAVDSRAARPTRPAAGSAPRSSPRCRRARSSSTPRAARSSTRRRSSRPFLRSIFWARVSTSSSANRQIHPGLLSLPNVVLLPHLGSATFETRLAMARLACEEIARFARGEPPLHPVP